MVVSPGEVKQQPGKLQQGALYQATLLTPIGVLGIETHQDTLSGIHFLYDRSIQQPASDAFSKEVVKQLGFYFKNNQFQFDLPLTFSTTEFHLKVLKRLQQIPSGQTQHYGMIAEALATSARAVGNACRHNPIPIVIPCHRVVAKNHIGGFSGVTDGQPMMIKRWLLCHEETS